MSQKEVARAAGVTEAAVSRYCNGTRAPNADCAARLAGALGVTVDALLGRRGGSEAELDEALAVVVSRAAELDGRQRLALMRALAGV